MGGLLMMSSFIQENPRPSPNAFECKFCHKEWLVWSKVKSPKGAPLPLSYRTLQYHDCPESPWNIQKRIKSRAFAVKKGAIDNIVDYELIDKARLEIAATNSRLAYHNIRLEVKQTRPLPEEESSK